MPRGDHLRKVTDDQIVSVFQRNDFPRQLLAPAEVAKTLNEDVLDGEEISGEAVRQRMHKIDVLETEEIGGAVLWKRRGAAVYASNEIVAMSRNQNGGISGHVGALEFESRPLPHLGVVAGLTALCYLTALVSVGAHIATGSQLAVWTALVTSFGTIAGVVGTALTTTTLASVGDYVLSGKDLV